MPKRVTYQYNTRQEFHAPTGQIAAHSSANTARGGLGGFHHNAFSRATMKTERGAAGGGGAAHHHNNHRENRINPGSVFSNDSSTFSISGAVNLITSSSHNNNTKSKSGQAEPSYISQKVSTSDNHSENLNDLELLSTNNQQQVGASSSIIDHAKHIHFAIQSSDNDNIQYLSNSNLLTNKNNNNNNNMNNSSGRVSDDENLTRLSTGDFMSKNGMVASSSFHLSHENETASGVGGDSSGGGSASKSGSITHLSQKRNSFKSGGRRASLKYRVDRANRSANNTVRGGANSSQASVKRKLSHGTSLSFYDHNRPNKQENADDNDFNTILSVPNANIDETLIISEEEAAASVMNQTAPHGGINSSNFYSNTAHLQAGGHRSDNVSSSQVHEFCEVEEIDFNRCFPWINVVIKFMNSVDYNCTHSSSGGGASGVNASSSAAASDEPVVRNRKMYFSENCCKNCYLKMFRNSHSLVEAVLRIYETSNNSNLFEKYQKQMKHKPKDSTIHKQQPHRLSKIDESDHNSSSKNRKVRPSKF